MFTPKESQFDSGSLIGPRPPDILQKLLWGRLSNPGLVVFYNIITSGTHTLICAPQIL